MRHRRRDKVGRTGGQKSTKDDGCCLWLGASERANERGSEEARQPASHGKYMHTVAPLSGASAAGSPDEAVAAAGTTLLRTNSTDSDADVTGSGGGGRRVASLLVADDLVDETARAAGRQRDAVSTAGAEGLAVGLLPPATDVSLSVRDPGNSRRGAAPSSPAQSPLAKRAIPAGAPAIHGKASITAASPGRGHHGTLPIQAREQRIAGSSSSPQRLGAGLQQPELPPSSTSDEHARVQAHNKTEPQPPSVDGVSVDMPSPAPRTEAATGILATPPSTRGAASTAELEFTVRAASVISDKQAREGEAPNQERAALQPLPHPTLHAATLNTWTAPSLLSQGPASTQSSQVQQQPQPHSQPSFPRESSALKQAPRAGEKAEASTQPPQAAKQPHEKEASAAAEQATALTVSKLQGERRLQASPAPQHHDEPITRLLQAQMAAPKPHAALPSRIGTGFEQAGRRETPEAPAAAVQAASAHSEIVHDARNAAAISATSAGSVPWASSTGVLGDPSHEAAAATSISASPAIDDPATARFRGRAAEAAASGRLEGDSIEPAMRHSAVERVPRLLLLGLTTPPERSSSTVLAPANGPARPPPNAQTPGKPASGGVDAILAASLEPKERLPVWPPPPGTPAGGAGEISPQSDQRSGIMALAAMPVHISRRHLIPIAASSLHSGRDTGSPTQEAAAAVSMAGSSSIPNLAAYEERVDQVPVPADPHAAAAAAALPQLPSAAPAGRPPSAASLATMRILGTLNASVLAEPAPAPPTRVVAAPDSRAGFPLPESRAGQVVASLLRGQPTSSGRSSARRGVFALAAPVIDSFDASSYSGTKMRAASSASMHPGAASSTSLDPHTTLVVKNLALGQPSDAGTSTARRGLFSLSSRPVLEEGEVEPPS